MTTRDRGLYEEVLFNEKPEIRKISKVGRKVSAMDISVFGASSWLLDNAIKLGLQVIVVWDLKNPSLFRGGSIKPSLNRTRIKVCGSPSGIGEPQKVKRGNPNPSQKLKPFYGDEAMSEKTISVRLPKDLDAYLRTLPNKMQWLREAAIEKREREKAAESDSDRNDGET